MSETDDYPRSRPFYSNPHHPIGRRLWSLSRPKYAGIVGFIVALGGAIGLILMGTGFGGAGVLLGIVAALAWFMAFVTVSEFANEVLCASCGYPQREENHYCPACGAGVSDVRD